jgi:hypothetical protein
MQRMSHPSPCLCIRIFFPPDIPGPRLDSPRVSRVEVSRVEMVIAGGPWKLEPPPLHPVPPPSLLRFDAGRVLLHWGISRNNNYHTNHATHMQSENVADSVDGSRPVARQTRRPRAARACDLCRVKKNKCNEEIPCSYCRSQSHPVAFSYVSLCELT